MRLFVVATELAAGDVDQRRQLIDVVDIEELQLARGLVTPRARSSPTTSA
ncbi:hypothetical protein [Amycolatopsis sp. NPDC004378]